MLLSQTCQAHAFCIENALSQFGKQSATVRSLLLKRHLINLKWARDVIASWCQQH